MRIWAYLEVSRFESDVGSEGFEERTRRAYDCRPFGESNSGQNTVSDVYFIVFAHRGKTAGRQSDESWMYQKRPGSAVQVIVVPSG